MKSTTFYLLLAALLGITAFLSFAQQNQNTQKPNPEIEALKKRISVLESKLQTVENVEKMELEAKLAEANAKLINTDIDKLKGELRESNNDWLRAWNNWFVGIVSVIAVIIGAALWLVLKTLIGNGIEKSLNGFKDAFAQVNTLKNELRILRKEQAAFLLEATFQPDFGSELGYPKENEARREETLKELSEETLLDVFGDKKHLLAVRHKAAEIMTQKSPPLVGPVLELLNLAIDPDSNSVAEIGQNGLRNFIFLLVEIETPETYEGLTKFLNRLLTENPEHKDMFLTWTVFSLAYVSIKLNKREAASILRRSIPYLDVRLNENQALKNLVRLFDIFNEPAGIRDILTNGLTDGMPDAEDTCLELLQKYDPEFVEKWKAEKATPNTKLT